jgi:hypothetical protein
VAMGSKKTPEKRPELDLIACFCALRLRPDLGMLHQQWLHYREHILDLDGKAEPGSIQ